MSDPQLPPQIPIEKLEAARRIVVKLGTNVVCRPGGEAALGRVSSLIEEIVDLRRQGREVILVSSGSIGLGMQALGLESRPQTLGDKQACAAAGQPLLMELYQHGFEKFGLHTAQVLLTEDDFADRSRYLNLRTTLNRLLELGAIPVVNENDTISTSEIETRVEGDERSEVFGDNDVLSALVASKLRSDLLIILSNVDGLHDANPAENRDALPIRVVRSLKDLDIHGSDSSSTGGRGGFRTKLRAAEIATRSGVTTIIARGSRPEVLGEILAGQPVGTYFLASTGLPSRKSWMAYATSSHGAIEVNAGARRALETGQASLLFAGVLGLRSEFQKGEIVSILDEQGREFARGKVNFSSEQARKLIGAHSSQVALLEEDTRGGSSVFVHRDHIVFL